MFDSCCICFGGFLVLKHWISVHWLSGSRFHVRRLDGLACLFCSCVVFVLFALLIRPGSVLFVVSLSCPILYVFVLCCNPEF